MKKLVAILLSLVFIFVFSMNTFACYVWNPQTAWALVGSSNPINSLEGIGTNKWGWYIDASKLSSEPIIYVYAGGGNNENGTFIGTVTISINNGYYSAQFNPSRENYITNMHLGVYDDIDDLIATKGAPGRFTNDVPAEFAKYIIIHFDAMVAQLCS